MCKYVDSVYIVPGWGCCRCRIYNGMQRTTCRNCGAERCEPLQPDTQTGTVYETRRNHREELPS